MPPTPWGPKLLLLEPPQTWHCASACLYPFFFFFTILFITISVLFSCKGIQQKLLKRSCPQNGAAHFALPWCAPPPPQGGGEAGVLFTKESLQPWGPRWGHWRGDACLGGVLSVAISKVPLVWGLGHGMDAPRSKKLRPFFATSARAKSSRQGQQRTLLPRSSPQGAGRGSGGNYRGEP